MYTPSRQCTPGLLAFSLWIAFSLMSATVQSAQLEPPAAASVTLLPNAPPLGASGTNEASLANPTVREWTTKETSLTLVLHKGTTIVIGPYSRVKRLPMIPVALGGKEYAKSAFNIELVTGRIEVDIDPNTRPLYGMVVRAPRKVGAIIKTGKATIVATRQDITIAAWSGKDMMSAIDEHWRPLRIGKAFTVNDKNPGGAQRFLLPSPTVQIDAPVAIAIGTTVTQQRLSWTSISGSTGYVLRLYRHVGTTFVLVREQRLNENSLQVDNLKAGRYSATVSSLDETNLESSPSPKVGFRIVEAVPPPGALVIGNTIQLPATERLQFLHVENMELSYGYLNPYFVTAPQSVGLCNGHPTQIRLREKGSNRETRIQLDPLVIVPTIEFTPTRVTWPGTPITVTIVAKRWDGSPAPTEDSLSPAVSINNQPITVQWHKTLGKMSCQVEKPATLGPWVVRILLRDTEGRILAQSFLEVAERRTQSGFTEPTP